MKWKVHSAIIIGTEHERSKRNRQDFCGFFLPGDPAQSRSSAQKRYGGVVCDGCSEGFFSEVGASLLGNLILTLIKKKDITKPDAFGGYIENNISRFIRQLCAFSKVSSIHEKVQFIHNFLLTTFIFAVIEEGRLFVGHSGDGVIIINDDIRIIDQQGKPQYIAYREIPEDFFTDPLQPGDDFSMRVYEASTIRRMVIASDGLIPLITEKRHTELFGTRKRQLQRKFNVWQQKEKLFYDDVSCIVFEKMEEKNEFSA